MFTPWYIDAKQVRVLPTILNSKEWKVGTLPPQPEADGSGHTRPSIPPLGQGYAKELRHMDPALHRVSWEAVWGCRRWFVFKRRGLIGQWWARFALPILRSIAVPMVVGEWCVAWGFLGVKWTTPVDDRMGVPITGGDGLHGGKLGREGADSGVGWHAHKNSLLIPFGKSKQKFFFVASMRHVSNVTWHIMPLGVCRRWLIYSALFSFEKRGYSP